MKAKKKLAVLFTAALLALTLGIFAACAEEEHSLTYVEEVAATCTEAGHEAYYLCSHCGKLFADENAETELSDADVTIAALGHDMTHHEAVAATCTVNGNIEYWSCSRCEKNFSDEAGTKEAASVTILAQHDIRWVDAVEPTASSEGMLAHYECSKCHTCYEDADGKEVIDREDLVLAELVEQTVTVTVEVYNTAGEKIDSPDFTAISGKLGLLGAYSANQYEGLTVKANGELELASIIVGEYTVELYGYSRSTFTVTQGTSAYTLKLHATIAYGSNDKVTVDDKTASVTIKGSVADYQNNQWSGSAELVLSEDVAGSNGVVLNFNIKNVTNSQASGNDEWASQRIAIQMAQGYEGFLFFLPNGEANIFDMTDNIIRDEGKDRFGNDGHTYDWIGTLMRGANGVNMRIVRTGELVTLFAQNAGSQWVSIGSVECGSAKTDIVLYGCGVEWKFSSVAVQKLEYHEKVEATPEKPGNYAYYTDGTNYWFEDGEQTTEDGVKLYMPVEVTLAVSGIALDGKTSEAVASGTVITFTSRAATYTYTVGSDDALTKMIAGDYTVTAEGYRTQTINVSTSGGAVNVTLIKVISIEGDVADYAATRWSDSVTLDISDDLKASTAVILEFNVRNVTNSAAGWPTDEWASQRIAIQMAQGNEGFLFFLPKGEANIFDMTDSSIRNEGKTQFSGSYAWIDTLMRGASGVNMRLVRTGENVTLFVQNAESEWVKIGTVACGSAATEIVFYGCGVEWEFSSVTAEEITYVPEKEATATEDGNIEYYKDGENYWLPDGTVTTEADTVVKYAAPVTLKLTGVALDGKTQEELDGTVLTFTNNKGSFTYIVGETENFKLSPDTYTVTAEGYRSQQVTVPEEGGELELTLTKVITIGKGAVELTNNAWNGQQTIAVPDTITGDFLFEVTLKMSDFTTGAGELGAWQRYAIRLTEGSTGFYFWSWDNGGYKTFIRQFGANNLNNAKAENDPVNGDEANNGYILNELLDADGLQLRILRAGNTFYLYALNGSDWVKLGSVTCTEGDKIDMEVYAGVGTYEWSNVNFTNVSFVEEKAPVVGGENGNVAHYTDGTNYWLADGTPTTADAVVITAVNVTLTVNGLALDGTTEKDVAEGTVITFTGTYGNYSYKMGEAAPTEMFADTYTVTAEGYAVTTLVVSKQGGALTLTLKEAITIVGSVADYTSNQWSGSAELALSDEVKQSTNVTLEFTVKNVTNSSAGWPTDEWASQRIAIQMAQGYEGFLFFAPSNETNIFDMTDNAITDGGKTRLGADNHTYDWVNTLMRGENGANMRIVREGASVTLFAQNAELEWVEIGTVTCASADAETEIIFYGCGVTWEFTSVTVTPNAQE